MDIALHTEQEWEEFAEANQEALLEIYGTIKSAHTAACQGGIMLGGGAQPEFFISFVD